MSIDLEPIRPGDIHVGMTLVEKVGNRAVKVHQENNHEIAWFGTTEDGGVFGECTRKAALGIFKNVAAPQLLEETGTAGCYDAR